MCTSRQLYKVDGSFGSCPSLVSSEATLLVARKP